MTKPKKPYAVFVCYWEPGDGLEPFAMFNCFDDQMEGSTVTKETLKWKGIPIPEYPKFSDWKKQKEDK